MLQSNSFGPFTAHNTCDFFATHTQNYPPLVWGIWSDAEMAQLSILPQGVPTGGLPQGQTLDGLVSNPKNFSLGWWPDRLGGHPLRTFDCTQVQLLVKTSHQLFSAPAFSIDLQQVFDNSPGELWYPWKCLQSVAACASYATLDSGFDLGCPIDIVGFLQRMHIKMTVKPAVVQGGGSSCCRGANSGSWNGGGWLRSYTRDF